MTRGTETEPASVLAKSSGLGLARHSFDTETVARQLFAESSPIGSAWLRMFRIGSGDANGVERFVTHLRLATLFHDLGKANTDFQALVRGRGGDQCFRHEHLSCMLLFQPAIKEWLVENGLELDLIAPAVLGHHCKAGSSVSDGRYEVLSQNTPMDPGTMMLSTDVDAVLEMMGVIVGTKPVVNELDLDRIPAVRREIRQRSSRLGRLSRGDGTDPGADPGAFQAYLAIKAALISCDAIASARTADYQAFIQAVESLPPLTRADIEADVINPRIATIPGYRPHPFQDEIAAIQGSATLLSGCGSGKTLAAWRWAALQVERLGDRAHVLFLYPTRGTANEGFLDYLIDSPGSGLVHGTAGYDIRSMMIGTGDEADDRDDIPARIDSLSLWTRRYLSATTDQFMSWMAHSYQSTLLMPVLARSVVVIDEVHSYDARMWAQLRKLLERLNVPVLCMSASIPRTHLNALSRLMPVHESNHEGETLERYAVENVGRDTALQDALRAYRDGQRVLWVVNTVKACQRVYQELVRRVPGNVGIYHSRYRPIERRARHAETIQAFRGRDPVIVVTTQVCEMSLDISADVMVTELAPATALIQRLGRVNRYARVGDESARVYVYKPSFELPYSKDEIDGGMALVRSCLQHETISQARLAEILANLSVETNIQAYAPFFASGYYALRGGFRETLPTSSVVRESDVNQPLHQVVIKVPGDVGSVESVVGDGDGSSRNSLPAWVAVVPDSYYDSTIGYTGKR